MSKQKVFIFFTILSSLAVLVGSILSTAFISRRFIEDLTSYYTNQELKTTQKLATLIEERFLNIQQELILIRELPQIKEANLGNCNSKLIEVYPFISDRVSNIAITNAEGEYICSVDGRLLGKNAKESGRSIPDFFEHSSKDSFAVSDVIQPYGFEQPFILVYVPIYNNSTFSGTISGLIYLYDFEDIYFNDVTFNQQDYVFVHDQNGDIVYHPNKKYIGENFWSDVFQNYTKRNQEINSFMRDAYQGNSATHKYTSENEEYLAAYTTAKTNKDQSWVIGITIPTTELESAVNISGIRELFLLLSAMLFLIILCTFSLFAYLIVKKIFNPLNKVTNFIYDMAEGALDVEIDIEGKDEIGILASAFNEMANKLKTSAEILLDNIGDGVIVTDKEGTIRTVNDKAEEMFEFELKKILNKPLIDVLVFEDLSCFVVPPEKRLLTLVLKDGEPLEGQYYYYKNDGKKQLVSVKVFPMKYKGKVTGAMQVITDITQEAAFDQAKSDFVSLASHQLRTPLSTISWHTELLLRPKYMEELSEDHIKHISQVRIATQRMIKLVNSLLNVSRLELGTFAIEPENLSIAEIVSEVIKENEMQIRKKQLQLKLEIQPDLPSIQSDKVLVHNIVSNLVSNSIKYTSNSGIITVKVYIQDEKRAILIEVADNGCGIPAVQQDEVFDKLFRADNARKLDSEGTGLGLYIIKLILSYIGGVVWFNSWEDAGTTFYVSLPLSGMQKKEGNTVIV